MNAEAIKELKRLAEAATPGPWIAAGPSFNGPLPVYCDDVCVDREGDEDDGYSICGAPVGLEESSTGDMEFIAAANPSAIKSLIAQLEAAHAELAAIRALEPVAFRISYPNEPDLGFWFAEGIGGQGCLTEPLYELPEQK